MAVFVKYQIGTLRSDVVRKKGSEQLRCSDPFFRDYLPTSLKTTSENATFDLFFFGAITIRTFPAV